MTKNIKRILVSLGAVALLSVPVFVAQAAELAAPGKDDGGNLMLLSTEVHKNLYAVGGNVSIESKTDGDLYVAGGKVSVTGPVEQDLVAAGGSVDVTGTVGGDVRVASGNITISNTVGGDVVVAGGTVILSDKAKILGDLLIAGGSVTVNGPVDGYAKLAGGQIVINSKIGGDVTIHNSNTVTFGAHAEVSKHISVTGKLVPVVADGAKLATPPDFTLRDAGRGARAGFAALATTGTLISLLAGFLAAWLLIRLAKGRVTALTSNMLEKPWPNLGIGLVGVIVAPIASILLFVTFVGYYIGLVVLALFILLMLLSCLVGSIFLGAWLIKVLGKKSALTIDWQAAALGAVVLLIVGFIPIIGWIAECVLLLMAFGALLRWSYGQLKE